MARAIISLSFCLLFATACASPLTASPAGPPSESSVSAAVDGFAPTGPNVSLVPDVLIYTKALSPTTMQMVAYDTRGTLLWVTITSGDVVKVLPFGIDASKVNVDKAPDGPKADPIAQCPCNATVVYDGPNGTVIFVTDVNGNLVQVIQLPPRTVQK